MELEKIMFAHLVGNFDEVKKLYEQNKNIEAYKLYKTILKDINTSTKETGTLELKSI